MEDVTGRYRCSGSIPGAPLSFNPWKSNYPAGAWWIVAMVGLSKKRTITMESSSIGRAAVCTIKQGEQDLGSSPNFSDLPVKILVTHIGRRNKGSCHRGVSLSVKKYGRYLLCTEQK